MFIGHYAVGMAGKRLAPKVSLPVLFLAAQFADTLWPILLAAGVEKVQIVPTDRKFPLDFISYPWSHSLLMLVVWGALFGFIYRRYTGDSRGALVIGALVVSHWVLDFLTHHPDLPLLMNGPKVGLGLWSHARISMAVETLLFAGGVAIYEGTTKAKDKQGQYSFWFMVILLLGLFVLTSGGAPPPDVGVIWIMALFFTILLLLLARYIDKHRTLEHPEPNPSGRTRTPVQPFY